jgi:hypothetical protein
MLGVTKKLCLIVEYALPGMPHMRVDCTCKGGADTPYLPPPDGTS